MLRPTLGVHLLLAACASADTTPASASAPAPARAQAADASPSHAASSETATVNKPSDSPWHWRSEAADAITDPHYLLGLVGQTGIEHCPGGGYDRKWLALRPTIGRVSVSGPDDPVFDPLMDGPVLALGLVTEAPPRAARPEEMPEKLEPCLPAQMRSDWRMTPRGLLIERDSGPAIAHFEVAAVRPLDELQVRIESEHLIVTLTNPVPIALSDVELVVHYEGCFGKPGSTVETTTVGELGVRAQASARVPTLRTREGEPAGRAEFRAYSVQLRGRGEGVTIDLDVPLRHFGAGVECPDR